MATHLSARLRRCISPVDNVKRCDVHHDALSWRDSEGYELVAPVCYRCLEDARNDPRARRHMLQRKKRELYGFGGRVQEAPMYLWDGSHQHGEVGYVTPLGLGGERHELYSALHPLEYRFYEEPRRDYAYVSEWTMERDAQLEIARMEDEAAAEAWALEIEAWRPRRQPTYRWIPELPRLNFHFLAAVAARDASWETLACWLADIVYWVNRFPRTDRLIFTLYLRGYLPHEIAAQDADAVVARGARNREDIRDLNIIRRLGLTGDEVRDRIRSMNVFLRGSVRGRWQA